MASACAVACRADTLIFLTDVAGVKNAEGVVMPWLNTMQISAMVESAEIAGGMLPEAGGMWPGPEARRGAGTYSAGITGGHAAAVLSYQALRRHGGDGRMSLAAVVLSESKLLLPTYDRQRVLFKRGRGVYLWDSRGKRYLDFLSGIGVNALGHAHPVIQSTLKRQAGRLIHVSNLFFHEFRPSLRNGSPKSPGFDKAFFCNSGTEAWEGALKMARAYARTQNNNGHKAKWRLLALENSSSRTHFGSLATTGQEKYRHPFTPLVPGVGFVGFNDVDDLKRQFDGSVYAICLETIQGEGEIRRSARSFCRPHDSCAIAPARC